MSSSQFVDGPIEENSGEYWPLTLVRGPALELRTLSSTTRIHAIHQRLRSALERLQPETELLYTCRVADGLHLNAANLIAVELIFDARMERVLDLLGDDFVVQRPRLLLRRGLRRLAAKDRKAGLDDLARGLDTAFTRDDHELLLKVFTALEPAQREQRRPLFEPLFTNRSARDLVDLAIDLEWWPAAELTTVVHELETTESPRLDSWTLEQLVAELSKRSPGEGAQVSERLERRAAFDSSLQPALLTEALTRDATKVAVYADALSEADHPFGEFLALSLQGTSGAKRKAKALAKTSARAWLGPLATLLSDVEYEQGLPFAAVLATSAPERFDFEAALRHPMLAAWRRVLLKRSKKTRRSPVDAETWHRLARALVPLGLEELDCAHFCLEAVRDLDLGRLTRLHNLDLTDDGLDPGKFPSVKWVEVLVRPGTCGATLQQLRNDEGGFFKKLKPQIELVFLGGASAAEKAQVQAFLPFPHGAITIA